VIKARNEGRQDRTVFAALSMNTATRTGYKVRKYLHSMSAGSLA